MQVQGTLKKDKNTFYLETVDGIFSIHSDVDAPKVSKLDEGVAIYGDVRTYSPKDREKLGWTKLGSVETGHLYVGKMKDDHS